MLSWIFGGAGVRQGVRQGVRAGSGRAPVVEALEGRRMLTIDLDTPCPTDEFCIQMNAAPAGTTATVGPDLVGKYKGKVTVEGRPKAINSKVHIITHVGNRVTGTFQVQNLGIVQFAVSGKSKRNGSFTVKGSHLGFTGELQGKRAKDGSLSGTWTFSTGSKSYAGTFAYTKTS